MRAKSYYASKAKRTKNPSDWQHFRRLRNQVSQKMREAKRKHFETVSEQCSNNPGKAWKELNRVLGRGCRPQIEVVKTQDGVVTDKQEIAEEFKCFFSRWLGGSD